jgi:hypothetical protein
MMRYVDIRTYSATVSSVREREREKYWRVPCLRGIWKGMSGPAAAAGAGS